ncbi:MAG: 1-deoxy-D-xylulose-5-phosphate reductoisomerase [Clostridiales Family XIII bacterium]|jgi:1-deoxy-D-xylulose-5-phosphate reductoisomerase|nr:1-deoxy-D-xylulose-5-phosphate reductoisomerase [Clostridiales Family XIII bacterium]
MKDILLLGSTGSVGSQALSVLSMHPDKFKVKGLACRRSSDVLLEQIHAFRPEAAAVEEEAAASAIGKEFPGVKLFSGEGAAEELAGYLGCDVVFNSMVGISGLAPTMRAISRKPQYIALANKETLVAGGRLIMEASRASSVPIIPVDSEHSAIFQCLTGKPDKIILTCSGGPFRGKGIEELKGVTVESALKHPNWEMGLKVTIDSATLMNKGLEVIEAKWLFGLDSKNIKVVIHPQSIVHSLVEYEDGALLAQLGLPDMKVPISYALTWPERQSTGVSAPKLSELSPLSFEAPDIETFKCLRLAFEAIERLENEGDDGAPIAYEAAGQVLAEAFVDGKIGFLAIGDMLEKIMSQRENEKVSAISDIMRIDKAAGGKAAELIAGSGY